MSLRSSSIDYCLLFLSIIMTNFFNLEVTSFPLFSDVKFSMESHLPILLLQPMILSLPRNWQHIYSKYRVILNCIESESILVHLYILVISDILNGEIRMRLVISIQSKEMECARCVEISMLRLDQLFINCSDWLCDISESSFLLWLQCEAKILSKSLRGILIAKKRHIVFFPVRCGMETVEQ